MDISLLSHGRILGYFWLSGLTLIGILCTSALSKALRRSKDLYYTPTHAERMFYVIILIVYIVDVLVMLSVGYLMYH